MKLGGLWKRLAIVQGYRTFLILEEYRSSFKYTKPLRVLIQGTIGVKKTGFEAGES